MIVFDLACDNSHRFEGWFRSSADFAEQREAGLIVCPTCGSEAVDKAPMAPAVPSKGSSGAGSGEGNAQKLPPEFRQAIAAIAEAQAKALKSSTWVGGKFAEEARSMHYGEKDSAAIHGQATGAEAKALADEGIAVAPLLVPVAPPEEIN